MNKFRETLTIVRDLAIIATCYVTIEFIMMTYKYMAAVL